MCTRWNIQADLKIPIQKGMESRREFSCWCPPRITNRDERLPQIQITSFLLPFLSFTKSILGDVSTVKWKGAEQYRLWELNSNDDLMSSALSMKMGTGRRPWPAIKAIIKFFEDQQINHWFGRYLTQTHPVLLIKRWIKVLKAAGKIHFTSLLQG